MDEMKQLARVLENCTSFKNRQECLTESLDYLAFNYPDTYTLLYRDIKKRELEYNDPNKIMKWLSVPQPNSYMKLHEALMLVKNHNTIAKEEYLDCLKKMLCETIEKGTDIDMAMKICTLIEKSPHLKSIYKCLVHHIQQIKQMNINNHFSMGILVGNLRQTHLGPSKQLDVLRARQVQTQQQHVSNWPTMLNPTDLITLQYLPRFNLKSDDYKYQEMISTINGQSSYDFLKTTPKITIVLQHMDGVVTKWLYYLKLHKYQWFFNELSYLEIELIDMDNINQFIVKVNRNSITKGAQKKICLSTTTLRERRQKFKDLLMALDLEVTASELCELTSYMHDILHYPIPNKNCLDDDQLQQDIVLIMEKSLKQLLEKLNANRVLISLSLLGTSINKYLECTILIMGNSMFTKYQIDKMRFFADTLKYKVHCMRQNIN